MYKYIYIYLFTVKCAAVISAMLKWTRGKIGHGKKGHGNNLATVK